jgi:hypothetical protein
VEHYLTGNAAIPSSTASVPVSGSLRRASRVQVMPDFLEKKLKKQYPGNDSAVYGTMNKIGAMHGNKITPKGREMEAKHFSDMGKR